VTGLATLGAVVEGARCWGIELDPRYRVLAVTIEPDPLRTPGTAGEHQLLCFPVSVLLVAATRPLAPEQDGAPQTALVTFGLEQLTAVSERFAGARLDTEPFGQPEPRPGAWGPRYSLEGRTSAGDGNRTTFTLDLSTEDGSRLRVFARFDHAELRDGARRLVLGTPERPGGDVTPSTPGSPAIASDGPGGLDGGRDDLGAGADPLQF